MSGPWYEHEEDGQEVREEELNAFATAAAHADDAVFQELFKLAGFSTTPDRAVIPFGLRGANQPIVTPGPAASPINVYPFRLLLGPRNAPNATVPVDNSLLDPNLSGAELALRDVRSAVFAPLTGAALLTQIPAAFFGSNSSGFPRWDLVYATLYVDQSSNTTRFVKPPGTTQAAPAAVSSIATTSVGVPPGTVTGFYPGIKLVEGTPGSSPVPPAIADNPSAGFFNFPLAYVLVPNGFVSGTSTFATTAIAMVAANPTLAEAIGGKSATPVQACQPSNLLTAWASGGTRPSVCLPSTAVGGASKRMLLDATLIAGSAPLGNGAVVDASIDWRKRAFRVECFTIPTAGASFAADPAGSSPPYLPNVAPAAAVALNIVQPLIVQGQFPATAFPAGFGGYAFIAAYDALIYYVALPNLIQGATLQDVLFYGSSANHYGDTALQLFRGSPSNVTGATQLGSTTEFASGVLSNTPQSVPGSALSVPIDTTQYHYFVQVTGTAHNAGVDPVQIGAPVVQVLQNLTSNGAVSWGQSFKEDSAWALGSELGSGAGMAALFFPTNLPQMASGAGIGLYVPLTGANAGNLMLFYQGTPALKMVFQIEATGAFDNV